MTFASAITAFAAASAFSALSALAHLAWVRAFSMGNAGIRAFPGCFATGFALMLGALLCAGAGPLGLFEASTAFAFLFLAYAETMFKAYRGFSHTIVCDVARQPGVTERELYGAFAGGTGIDAMFERRLETMVSTGLIEREGAALRATRKGRRAAAATLAFKRFLRMGNGG